MIRTIKDAVVLLALLLPALAFGHEGHGTPGTLAHDFNHASWLVFGAVVVVATVLVVMSACGKDDDTF